MTVRDPHRPLLLLFGIQLLDPRGHHLREASGAGSAPVEPSGKLAVYEDVVPLGDALDGALPHRLYKC
jgi:hypothetical protein